MSKVYISGSIGGYWPHESFGEATYDFDSVLENPANTSLIVLPGGADIDPRVYGHGRNEKTWSSPAEDRNDIRAIDFAIKYDIPLVGICRGGQMLVAKAGGYLYQHVSGHRQNHFVRTTDGQEFKVTSCHHQMFGWPLPEKSVLIAWSKEPMSQCYETFPGITGGGSPPLYEAECVFLPTINALATQWHPEWMREDTAGKKYYQFLLERFIRPMVSKRFKCHPSGV